MLPSVDLKTGADAATGSEDVENEAGSVSVSCAVEDDGVRCSEFAGGVASVPGYGSSRCVRRRRFPRTRLSD